MDRSAIFHANPRITFQHTTSLHSFVPIPSEMTSRNLVVTGGEDENLTVWEDSGDGFTPISRVEAHSHVVSTLRIWQPEGQVGLVLSGSLDGTIRRWTLQGMPFVRSPLLSLMEDLLHPPPLKYEDERTETTMTAEEEQELMELMDEE